MFPKIKKFEEQQSINNIQPFKQCPINEVLKVPRLYPKHTKIGLSHYKTNQQENTDTYSRYWILKCVKTKMYNATLPCCMLYEG